MQGSPLVCCVTMGKLLNFSVPHLPLWKAGTATGLPSRPGVRETLQVYNSCSQFRIPEILKPELFFGLFSGFFEGFFL